VRYSIITVLTLFVLSGVHIQTAAADPTSETLVAQGRVLLFDSSNPTPAPTYSGLLAAHEKFQSAIAADVNDQSAQLFYAFTRIMVTFIAQGNSAGIDTMRELLEAFGLSRNSEDSVDSFPYGDLPETSGAYIPPTTIPSGEEVRAFLADDFTTLIDSAIGNLDAISSDFSTILTTAETGDIFETEIDYGDVLFIKSLLYSFKAAIETFTAYDMSINLHDIVILANAGVFQMQRDLLDKYNTFLALNPGGAPQLASAKASLLMAINTSKAAFTSITDETDPQDDDFFSFGSDAEVAEAYEVIATLTELQNSLNENRIYTETEEQWLLTLGGGGDTMLVITKDYNNNFMSGSFEGGTVIDYDVNGSIVTVGVVIDTDGPCPTNITLTGTLSGDSITGGTYSATYCDESDNGTFTGTKQESYADSFPDVNALFGNTGKDPLNIRVVLPEFDADGDMLAGTFPQPYLNNFMPAITTEFELVKEFGFPVVYDVQYGAITLDGTNDWPESFTVALDDMGDAYLGNPSGNDIEALSVARDDTNFYWMMSFNDPSAYNSTEYAFLAKGKTNDKSLYSFVYNGGYSLYSSYNDFWTYDLISDDPSKMGIGAVVEASIPLSEFDGTTKITVEGRNDYDHMDREVILKLPNDAELAGTISCNSFNGNGKIFIYVYDGLSPTTSHLLGTAVLDSPGSYTVPGLPIGKEVFVVALWDADDNGLQTFGDYVGNNGLTPVEILSSNTQSDINMTTEMRLAPQLFSENAAFADFFTSAGYSDYYAMKSSIQAESADQHILIQSYWGKEELPYAPFFDLLSDPYFTFRKTFSPLAGFPPPGSNWEGLDYTLFVDSNANESLDINEVHSQCSVPGEGIRQVDLPVVTVSGGSQPTISWEPVIGAAGYGIIFREITESNQLGDILFNITMEEDGSSSYSYTYDGDLFNQNDVLAVGVFARDDDSSCFYNRSIYFTTHMAAKKIDLTSILLLLLD